MSLLAASSTPATHLSGDEARHPEDPQILAFDFVPATREPYTVRTLLLFLVWNSHAVSFKVFISKKRLASAPISILEPE
jgi:hypothetical protein